MKNPNPIDNSNYVGGLPAGKSSKKSSTNRKPMIFPVKTSI
jgi:hypothetical protein